MANICRNEFYAYSKDKENLKVIEEFFDNWDSAEWTGDEGLDCYFDSKWTFPDKEMDKLHESIPNKDDIFMRCLSVEYGCDVVQYHKDEGDGWYDALN